MKPILLIISLLFCSPIFGQNLKTYLYEGKIDNKHSVTLYLQSQNNECHGELEYQGMYKYNGVSNWLQLDIRYSNKNQFVFIEYGVTGIMILKKNGKTLSGIWISPDYKKQLKVNFSEKQITPQQMKNYEDQFDKVNYENNDC